MANTQLSPVLRHIRKLAATEHVKERTDVQLLQEFAARNDQTAFAALVRRHGPMVLGVCRNILRHTQDAEDAFQATFLVLARKAATIHKGEALVGWLHGVAYRMAMNARRTAARRRSHEGKVMVKSNGDPAWETAWREVQELLDEEIRQLPEKYRAPFLLCCLEHRSATEAARQLGVKEGTVWSRLSRARQQLQQRLAKRGVTLSAVLAATAVAGNEAVAAVPALLVDDTAKAASAYAAGSTAAKVVSSNVAALLKGVTKTMLLGKAKSASAVLLAVCVLASGAVLATQRTETAKPAGDPPRETARPALPAADKDGAKEPVDVSGQVLDPEGKPAAGAKVYLWTSADKKKEDLPPRATTGTGGRFRFAVTKADLESDAKVIAVAKDFGPDWIELSKNNKPGEVTLRLAKDDVPVTGRILDLEGRPVPDAIIHVRGMGKPVDGDLGGWIDQYVRMRANGRYLNEDGLALLRPAPAGTPSVVTTDKNGRFVLQGFGRDRVLTLDVRGPTIEHTRIWAVTRTGPDGGWIKGVYGLYGTKFDYLVGPTKPFVGTVIDKRTRQPLAGIKVEGDGASTFTNDKGECRLVGVAKKRGYHLTAAGGKGLPYFDFTQTLDDTQGFEPIRADFEMVRGVEVTGRLTDKATGKPVRGDVMYDPLPDNPNRGDNKSLILVSDWGRAGPDGTFTTLALPGPGVLIAGAEDASAFISINARQELAKLGIRSFPAATMHGMVQINVSEKEPESLRRDFAFEPARTRQGSVLGPDGKPLLGVQVAGLTIGGPPQKLAGGDFMVKGLSPTKTRILIFLDAEKKLGKVVTFRGDQEEAFVARLEPLGALAGRVVDAEGKPLEAIKVTASPSVKQEEYDNLPFETTAFQGVFGMAPRLWHAFTTQEATTDADGKFRLDGLLPGLVYRVHASRGDLTKANTLLLSKGDVAAEAGKTKDLGDLKERAGNEPEEQ
jgi:RNA polymerase sigma factor (sigma-70 family)